MGDNLHFLEQQHKRRPDDPIRQRSMALYNSSDLTKFILDRANIGDVRTAISLADDDAGPYLLVERSGRVVTYLEKGMKIKDAAILPYSKLAAIVERIADWHDRIELAGKLVGPGGDVSALLRRLIEAGNDLTREEFRAISAWVPVFRGEILNHLVQLVREVEQERYELRKLHRIRKQDEPQLRRHWNRTWAIGHLTLLVAMDGREYMEALPDEMAWARGQRLSLFALSQGLIPLALRGAWAVGEIGRPTLEEYREAFVQATTPTTLLNAGLGLLAIAARHGRLLGQVRKTLARALDPPSTPVREIMQRLQRLLVEVTDLVFNHKDDWQRDLQNVLGGFFVEVMGPKLKSGSRFRFTDPKEVPLDLLLAMLGWVSASYVHADSLVILLCRSVPLVTAERAELLYFPQAVHADLIAHWTPERTLTLIQTRRLEQPKRTEPKPGRNEPCPCGSGFKYKHCHGQ